MNVGAAAVTRLSLYSGRDGAAGMLSVYANVFVLMPETEMETSEFQQLRMSDCLAGCLQHTRTM